MVALMRPPPRAGLCGWLRTLELDKVFTLSSQQIFLRISEIFPKFIIPFLFLTVARRVDWRWTGSGINSGTGPELVVRALDYQGFNWGWHGIGGNAQSRGAISTRFPPEEGKIQQPLQLPNKTFGGIRCPSLGCPTNALVFFFGETFSKPGPPIIMWCGQGNF